MGDSGLAGVLLLAFVLPTDLMASTDLAAGLAFSVALVACVPFRRRMPRVVFVVVSVLCPAQIAAAVSFATRGRGARLITGERRAIEPARATSGVVAELGRVDTRDRVLDLGSHPGRYDALDRDGGAA